MEKDAVLIPTNSYQTPITQEFMDSMPQEVQDQFMDFVQHVPLIRWMIAPDRPHAKDLPRDKFGRIVTDITKPHILDNMDYFRPSAKFFMENGRYNLLKPNPNPNSEYGKWFFEEVRRCREGYVRESDGEWVTGYEYYYLNYSPIMLNREDEETGIFNRVEDFPDFWEAIHFRYNYWYEARMHHKHAMELARRGVSKSFSLASAMTHNLILGENAIAKKRVTTVLTAYTKEYLGDKDGTFSKFTPMLDFSAANTEFPRLLVKRSPSEMVWIAGHVDANRNITKDSSQNAVMGLSVKDDEGKIRGKRGVILFEEMGCHLTGTEVLMYDGSIKKVEDIVLGDLLMGDDGTPRRVMERHHGQDRMYKITLTNGDVQIVNSKHLIPHIVRDWYRNTDTLKTATATELINTDTRRGYYIPKSNLTFKHKDVAIDPYLLGLWLGDGDKTWSSIVTADSEISEYLLNEFPDITIKNLIISDKCKSYYIPAKYNVVRNLRKMGLLNNKHVPIDYIYNDEDTLLKLLAGIVDTDGDYLKNKHSQYFEIVQCPEHLDIIKSAKRIAHILGFRASLRKKILGKNTKNPGGTYYVLRISGDLWRIPTRIKRKKAEHTEPKYKHRRNNNYYGFKIEEYGIGEFYGFTVDNNHLFLLEDMTITHNSYPNFKEVWNNVRDSVKEGSRVFAQMIAVGTSGDKESDFAGIRTMMYNPDSFEIYAVPNVYDLEGKETAKFCLFSPAYISRAGCMDKDGNSDVTKALKEILMERYIVKLSGDSATLMSRIAQMPITPAEAIMKVKSNFFPVTMINERLRQIDQDPRAFDKVYVGNLVWVGEKVEFRASDEVPIRDYNTSEDNTRQGALEIYEMPPKGDIPTNRYIIGHDPVDNDLAVSNSLPSTIVFDMVTDTIVAERTGRFPLADDNYDEVLKLCVFYNAKCLPEMNKKGIYSYFARKKAVWRLADCPEWLRQRGLVKYAPFGSAIKGVSVNAPINNTGAEFIKTWLMKTYSATYVEENGEVKTLQIQNVYRLLNRALLQEMVAYNPPVTNTDRVSALIQVMLYREELLIKYGDSSVRETQEEKDVSDDPFFDKDWNNVKQRLGLL